jgi:hypothetical protein
MLSSTSFFQVRTQRTGEERCAICPSHGVISNHTGSNLVFLACSQAACPHQRQKKGKRNIPAPSDTPATFPALFNPHFPKWQPVSTSVELGTCIFWTYFVNDPLPWCSSMVSCLQEQEAICDSEQVSATANSKQHLTEITDICLGEVFFSFPLGIRKSNHPPPLINYLPVSFAFSCRTILQVQHSDL